jgi:hypothetical protein
MLRAYVCRSGIWRAWVLAQGQANQLPVASEVIGSHWSRHVQADVVAVNWREHAILIGECTWSTDRVDRQIVRDLIEGKTPLVMRDLPDAGQGWTITYTCFARGGFTDAARQRMEAHQGWCIDLEMLARGLP